MSFVVLLVFDVIGSSCGTKCQSKFDRLEQMHHNVPNNGKVPSSSIIVVDYRHHQLRWS
jgi:hypothetical protein